MNDSRFLALGDLQRPGSEDMRSIVGAGSDGDRHLTSWPPGAASAALGIQADRPRRPARMACGRGEPLDNVSNVANMSP
jgi:hypothetical protein